MGEVYLAEHPRLPRRDALKILPADVSADPEFRSRFNREADLASTMYHPHIVGVHDRGEHGGQLWISMDYVEGPDAGGLIRDRYPAGMPRRDAIEIISAVAQALDYAHEKGLLHRDVKPANILVAEEQPKSRRVLLADFGIARSMTEIVGLTKTNVAVGTVNYAAPEQLMGLPLDGRSDQYALAVTAYHLFTGVLPFEYSNPAVIISHHLNASPPPLSQLRPELADLDPVLATALSKEPGDRFSKCIDFANALTTARANADTSATSVRPTAPAPVVQKELTPSVTEKRRVHTATKKISTKQPPPIVVHESRTRWPVVVSTIVMVILLAGVAVTFVVRPWQHDHNSNGTTSPPASITPTMTFDAMRDFVTSYYAVLPAHPDDAWAKVTPDGQHETGHDKFVDFWAKIRSVTLISITPRDATSVVARLHYVRQDGQTDTEDRWLQMAAVKGTILLQESGRIGAVGDTPPTQTNMSAKAIDRVLLTAEQLSKLVGADVTDDPAAAGGGMIELSLNSSAYGTSDHSGQVTPRSCVGVVFTAEHDVYTASEPTAIKTQTFGHVYGSGSDGPHLIEQTAAVFTSAAQAQTFLTSSQAQWETCAKGEVDATLGFENGAGYTLGGVERQGDLITVAMATNGGENGPDACQQALGVRENVVVEAEFFKVDESSGC
jgi:serine/threonine-protein kinase